jgi:23S rRNA pseudouridine1911/1915/1917 synthase
LIPENLNSLVLFADPDFLLVHKPAGLPCHPTVDNLHENLVAALGRLRAESLHITHRLDVGTQGLIILARNKSFHCFFNRALKEKRVQKYYRARVEGSPTWTPGQELRHFMKPDPRAPKVLTREELPGWQECLLRIEQCQGSWVHLQLLTGRTHQIRAQLGFEGFPLRGDSAYGAKDKATPLELISCEMSFLDQQGQARRFQI